MNAPNTDGNPAVVGGTAPEAVSCPVALSRYPVITMAHGGGGRLMNNLITEMFEAAFDNEILRARHDSACLTLPNARIAFTTDSFVVDPLFFPGGNIGKLSVCGTVNDLAVSGAEPLYLTLGLILEEGFPMETLWRIVQSIQMTAENAGVQIVAGDTKVVERGKADGIYINTSGVGVFRHDRDVAPARVRPGDAILVSGDLGRHGMAIMALRRGLEFESTIVSDCAPLGRLVGRLWSAECPVHCLRDLTRGGLTAATHEIAAASGCTLRIREDAVPVSDEVRGACEILGLDPLFVANEGRLVCIVPARESERALQLLQSDPEGRGAAQVGTVVASTGTAVEIETAYGVTRILDLPNGEQLPRIC